MQPIDVYGIGNALVDIEYQVEDDFFPAHGVRRGVMTLVTHERQEEIIAALLARGDMRKMMDGRSTRSAISAAGHSSRARSPMTRQGTSTCANSASTASAPAAISMRSKRAAASS